MSDLKCIKCESTETLMTQTIDGEEQRICENCSSQKMEEIPSDAVFTIEVATTPLSPGFKEPLAIKPNEVGNLIKINTEVNNIAKTSETIEECNDSDDDGEGVLVVDDDEDVDVVDEAMPSCNDLGKSNNYAGDAGAGAGESGQELKNEKHSNDTVVVHCEETKEIPIISKQAIRDPRILPPPPPTKDVIGMKAPASESEANQQKKDDDNKNQENTITKKETPVATAAATVENGASMVMASVTEITTTITKATTTSSSTATTTAAKVSLAPSAMTSSTIKTPTISTSTPSTTTAHTITPSSTASKIQGPKAKPVSPTKTSPTIIRRLRKSTRSTRFRSKMSTSGNDSAGAGKTSGPSGHHASHNAAGGSGTNAHSTASSSGKGQNKGGRNRRAIFKRPAVKTPIMHATTRFVTSVFFKGSYFQIGDIVSLVDSDNMVYYAQIRGLLVDAYCEKSAFLSWLIPTQDSPDPKEAFDPATYLIGPDEDFSRKLTYLKFVMHAPSNYFHDRTTPFPLPDAMNPIKEPGGYIWTHLPMEKYDQDKELRTDED